MSSILVAILLLIGAGFALSTATNDWSEVRDDLRARMIRAVLGDLGARTFYAMLGVALVTLAVGVLAARFSS